MLFNYIASLEYLTDKYSFTEHKFNLIFLHKSYYCCLKYHQNVLIVQIGNIYLSSSFFVDLFMYDCGSRTPFYFIFGMKYLLNGTDTWESQKAQQKNSCSATKYFSCKFFHA